MSELIHPIEFKKYSPEHFDDLFILFKDTFNDKVNKQQLLKKYAVSIHGFQEMSFIAYHKNKPVAFYGAWEYPSIYQGKNLGMVQNGDWITLAEYRGEGLIQALALKSYQLMQEKGVALAFAMHSEQTRKVTSGLDYWRELDRMVRFHIPANQFRFSGLLSKFSFTKYRYQLYIKKVLSNYLVDRNLFSNSLNEEYLSIEYNSDFMDYKTYTPNYVIKISSCLIWIKVGNVLSVGAINGLTRENKDSVVEQLGLLAKKLLLKEVVCHFCKDTLEFKLLSSVLPFYDSWMIGYVKIAPNIPFDKLRLNVADYDSY